MSSESEWSDSEDEVLSEQETSVLLGVPDESITTFSDLLDVAVSRIGGHPAFLTSTVPPTSSSQCLNCKEMMELVVQMWCPFEDSPMDRALYIWACARGACQGVSGSVRAWRGLRYNKAYADKLEKKLAHQRRTDEERRKKEEEAKKQTKKINPFSINDHQAPNQFGFGEQIFGGSALSNLDDDSNNVDDIGSKTGRAHDVESDAEDSLVVAMTSIHVQDSAWSSAPSYPPLYLSTVSEFISAPSSKIQKPAEETDNVGSTTAEGWSEAYENSMNLDQVFERFAKRVEYEGEQCVRYELNGIPLPFSSDVVFRSIFPPSTDASEAGRRRYSPASSSLIPPCPCCGSHRVFECQLMPNLIRVLDGPVSTPATEEERRKEVERALQRNGKEKIRGMEWGTCLIFSCSKDCCFGNNKASAQDCWREEVVLIQKDE